jgi:hypothetical protein
VLVCQLITKTNELLIWLILCNIFFPFLISRDLKNIFICIKLSGCYTAVSCFSCSFRSPGGSSYLDGIWSGAPRAENIQSPGGQSDRNSTSYGSLQQTSLLHETFNDHCQFGADAGGYDDFVTPSLSPGSGHHQLMTSTPFSDPSQEGCFAPFGNIVSSQGHLSDNRGRQTSSVAGFNSGYPGEPWHMTNAFSELTVGNERNAEPYTARNVNPIGTRGRMNVRQTAFGSELLQAHSDARQYKTMPVPMSAHSSNFAWNEQLNQSRLQMPNTCSSFQQSMEINVTKSSHSTESNQHRVIESVGREIPRSRDFGSPDLMGSSMRARMGETNQQEKLLAGHSSLLLAEELARIPPSMRQQYVDAIVAAHLANSAALLGAGASRFMPAAVWPHPAVYRCVVDPFAGSHVVNRKVPVIVGGPTPGPVAYDLPVNAPFAIPVPAFKSFRCVFHQFHLCG